jgi:putative CRISPR-associated protein (TIGR02620 family)
MKMEIVIVTRHKPLVEWLARRGITGRVIEHAAPEDLRGKHAIGVLPLRLAAECALVSEVAMHGLTLEARQRLNGGDFTVEEMDVWGAELVTYAPPRRLSPEEGSAIAEGYPRPDR